MPSPRYPSLYQINTRVWLTELSRTLGRTATLTTCLMRRWIAWPSWGFDWIWFLSVWQTGLAGQRVSRANAEWRREFHETLPDLREDGHRRLGFRDHRLHGACRSAAGIRRSPACASVSVDVVCACCSISSPTTPGWITPGWRSTRSISSAAPRKIWLGLRRTTPGWSASTAVSLLAHGRDPYFAGWPDTLQLNYANPATQEAMIGELVRIAGQCDGVRCDMAMLVLPDVFERTWGMPVAVLLARGDRTRVRKQVPSFCFMAEVYWDLEWTLQQQGFDYAYDKRLYDRLREGHARPVREHFHAGLDYQNKLARFLENHDEPRAAAAFPHGRA